MGCSIFGSITPHRAVSQQLKLCANWGVDYWRYFHSITFSTSALYYGAAHGASSGCNALPNWFENGGLRCIGGEGGQ